MKNILSIDIDTERTPQLQIRKPNDVEQPKTPDETKQMLITDIGSVCEALLVLIKVAHQNKYGDKVELVNTAKKYLDGLLNVAPESVKPVEG